MILSKNGGGKFEVRNPLARDHLYEGIDGKDKFSSIANDERIDILNCDATIAYVNQPSMGTAMGIMYAYLSGRTVVIVSPTSFEELSPMVKHHAHGIFGSFKEAVDFIEQRFSRVSISLIRKRDGTEVDWDSKRIHDAIYASIEAVYEAGLDENKFPRPRADKLANAVIMQIEDDLAIRPSLRKKLDIEKIQDKIEKILVDNAHRGEVRSLAKAYIIYRRIRQEAREEQGNENETMAFMNDILHDIKGPGGNIGRYIEFLEDALNTSDLAEAKEILEDLRKNQSTLMNNIMSSKAKAEKRFVKVKENLYDFVRKVFDNYKNQDIIFNNQIPEYIHVEASPDKLQVIFQNLFENSIKHGFKGKGGNIYVKAEKSDHGNFLMKYWNDGDAITDEEAEAMFSGVRDGTPDSESFHHGMSQTRRYIEELGGSIECRPNHKHDEHSNGSNTIKQGLPVFRIKLPLSDNGNSGRKRILVADDNESDRRMMHRILKKGGFEVVEAGSIDEALLVLENGQIYGAVLDVDFRETRNGLWLLKKIQKSGNGIKVIVVSGSTGKFNRDWRAEAERLGALKVFDKADYREEQILGVF